MGTTQTPLDLPLIVEATNEFYRQVYADATLGPIFKGLNMIVLRRHISYFVYELTSCEAPMTDLQIEHLRKVHTPIIAERHVNQRHFDILVSMLIASLRECGAQGQQLLLVQKKLRPFREIFPSQACSSVDGVCLLQGQQHRSSSRSSSDFGSSHSREQTQQRHHQPHHNQHQQLVQPPAAAQPDEQHQKHEHHSASQTCSRKRLQLDQGQQQQAVQIKADQIEQVHMVHAAPACNGRAVCNCVKQQLPQQEVTAAVAATGCSCKDASEKGDQQQQDQRAPAQSLEPARKSQLWWQRLLGCINGF